MTRLIISDLHLTDRPQDEYRFGIFPWVIKQTKKYNIDILEILGDLTDQWDNHPARLVNRIVRELFEVSMHIKHVRILKGNHDYVSPNNPFFEFLTDIPGIIFIKNPMIIDRDSFYLPHVRDVSILDGYKKEINTAKYIFMHQTMYGAVASNGYELPGLDPEIFKRTKAKIYSGDIHVPQILGKVTYVGSPYTVHFNDTFYPRALYIDDKGQETVLNFDDCLIRRTLTIESMDDIYRNNELRPGDQVKIKMKLPQEEMVSWPYYRKEILKVCEELKLQVFGVKLELNKKKSNRVRLDNKNDYRKVSKDPIQILTGYCKKNEISWDLKQAGKRLIKEDV